MAMAFCQPMTNLRDYASQNPPGVTFFVCLLTLAISFIWISSYSYTHTLPNPDSATDWNHLLSSLSHFQLCMKANATWSELGSPAPRTLMDRDTSVNSTEMSSLTTLHLKVPLAVTTYSKSGSMKNLGLQTAFRANQLHLGGNEIVNVTVEFSPRNHTSSCLTITAPARLLPMTLLPPQCPSSETDILSIHVEASSQQPSASQTCYGLQSMNDPSLTVMLTQEEQTVAVRHLIEVSVCLLGVCLILCGAASLTHTLMHRYHWNGMDLQNEPLIDP